MSNQTTSSLGLTHLNSTFDTEIDSFLELEPTNFSTAPSPAPGKAVPSLAQRPNLSTSTSSFSSSQSSQAFAGPSFQYDAYKQQTGLPVGALANTFAINRASGLQYNSNTGFVMPSDTLNVPYNHLDDFDYTRTPSLDFNEMDFDTDDSPSDLPAMFYPSASSANQDDSPTYSAPFQRMYPGMHSQQAAQAKAQQAQKQQEMLRQQQQAQQRAMAAAGQRSLPPSNGKAPASKDPVVEESISRLLNQMRQNSVASVEDDADTPTNTSFSGSRRHKDEDDMDEDEKLLASEEGKKLSSKERRQLRNKVSARAFRSRRKEYIGQLEGEIASRTQEANDLKVQNRQLMEENSRLTDLTRMLLSSPAFSGFLSEVNANGLNLPSQSSQSQTQTAPAPQPRQKDVNPHQAGQHMQSQQPQVNMAMLPESATDFSVLTTPFESWNSGLPSDFQVYSVTELPEGPVLDVNKLSGKGDNSETTTGSAPTAKDMPTKTELPSFTVPTTPPIEGPSTVDPNVELDEKVFDLYFDTSSSQNTTPSEAPYLASKTTYELVATSSRRTETSLERLQRLCKALDATCERLALMTPDM